MIQVPEGRPNSHAHGLVANLLLEPQIAQLAISQRRKSIRRAENFAFPKSRLAVPVLVPKRDQAHDRLLSAGSDDLLAPASLLDQPRKLGLGLVDGNGFHGYRLANSA